MELEKSILNFYEMSMRLEYFKLRIKQLKQQLEEAAALPIADIHEMQQRVNDYMEIEKGVEKIVVLPSQLLTIQNRVVMVLKEIGFPEWKKMVIIRSSEKSLAFWYDGAALFVEETQ